MSKGALIFAHNTDFNYLAQADLAAGLVKRNLSLPTTVVTDSASMSSHAIQHIDNVIVVDAPSDNSRTFRLPEGDLHAIWKNGTRHLAYNLSPYDQTLLVDSDYVALSDRLAHVFDTDSEVVCFGTAYDVTGQRVLDTDRIVGKHGIPMLWATVVYFRRGDFARSVFDFMGLVKRNYRYYGLLYGFPQRPFRNDYAFSIAMHTLNGYGSNNSYLFPWSLPTLTSNADLLELREQGREVVFGFPGDRYRVSKIKGQDLHIMNKRVFENQRFCQSVENIINEKN